MFEEGEPQIDGEAGDLKFVVITQPHKRFQRVGDDLRYNATISLMEALVGFSKQVYGFTFSKAIYGVLQLPGWVCMWVPDVRSSGSFLGFRDDLRYNATICLMEALVGFSKQVNDGPVARGCALWLCVNRCEGGCQFRGPLAASTAL